MTGMSLPFVIFLKAAMSRLQKSLCRINESIRSLSLIRDGLSKNAASATQVESYNKPAHRAVTFRTWGALLDAHRTLFVGL